MKTEKEYCVSRFGEKFCFLKGERIALYGTKANAKAILQQYPEYSIECLVDDSCAGTYVENRGVVSLLQFLELGIENLIIAAQIQSAEVVYNRIAALCKANGIRLYSMYGQSMYELHGDMARKIVNYPALKEQDIYREIDSHEIISFDIDNTLFTPRTIYAADFYEDIEGRLKKRGIEIANLTDKLEVLRRGNVYSSMAELLVQLGKTEELSPEQLNGLNEAVYESVKENLKPRTPLVDALKYAVQKGKRVCLIEDMQDYRISTQSWRQILKEQGIEGYDIFVSSAEYGKNKYNGLFRVITEKYGKASYLHIGDHMETDVLVPGLYDMDSFWVKRPFELYQDLDKLRVTRELLDKKAVRSLVEEFVIQVYNDEYLISKIPARREREKVRAFHLENRVKLLQNGNEGVTYEPVLLEDIMPEENIEAYPKLQFTEYQEPEVSIVIPVYNQFAYTYNCLKSILQHSGKVSYEIIIGDDCSTDQVREIEKVALGIRVIHNERNLRFLLNCNHAAKQARGKYILFLNNDTQVQPGWLRPLVALMERDEKAGMVGSKLVYPDGSLQEAGGILWKDGSAWNYGHLKNPEDPEYSYVKEADYISGAAIMIRAGLWREIGGFDTAFAPAYYEDTDLAFEVRKHGYKVMLQPASVVVHFEGVSNGTDTSSGLKSYQVTNQKKFYQKWKEVLEKEHFPNGTDVYLAKDRGQTRKQILVVDHYVPNYDRDAGGRCTYMYIKAFLKMGMKVTFIGDNFAKPQPYTDELNQLGVEILYGNYYYNNWQQWLRDNLHYFDYIYLQRPHISIKYIDLVKEYGRGKIFYFAHDLHHVRLQRDYEVTGNREALEEARKWKKIELELFDKADVGHVVGSYEQGLMQKEFPGKPIRNIPLYIYDKMPERIEKDFSKRKDILFVGGFGHTPNIDAVLWFAKEIYPKILKKYPDMVWHIVGSKAPAEVVALAGKNIVLEGFVSDEELEALYRKCRMAVVPLRYGAGVKGKVVESAYYQIPLITTSIGGEGLDASSGAFLMEDDAGKMAELVNRLYEDYESLRKMSDAGVEFIQTYFTSKVAEEVLEQDL